MTEPRLETLRCPHCNRIQQEYYLEYGVVMWRIKCWKCGQWLTMRLDVAQGLVGVTEKIEMA